MTNIRTHAASLVFIAVIVLIFRKIKKKTYCVVSIEDHRYQNIVWMTFWLAYKQNIYISHLVRAILRVSFVCVWLCLFVCLHSTLCCDFRGNNETAGRKSRPQLNITSYIHLYACVFVFIFFSRVVRMLLIVVWKHQLTRERSKSNIQRTFVCCLMLLDSFSIGTAKPCVVVFRVRSHSVCIFPCVSVPSVNASSLALTLSPYLGLSVR